MTGAHTQNRREGAASAPSHSRSAERAALSDESAELSAGTVGTLHAEAMSTVRGGRRPAGLRFCGRATRVDPVVRYAVVLSRSYLPSEFSSGGRGMSMRDRPANSPSEDRGDHNERAQVVTPGESHTRAKDDGTDLFLGRERVRPVYRRFS